MLAYVDNYGVLATSLEVATAGAEAVRRVMELKGVRVHPTVASDVEADFIGLRFNLRELSVGLRPSRSFRLRAAIRELIRRGHCSPALLEIIMGHCTWAALLRREALSVFDASRPYCLCFQLSSLLLGTRGSRHPTLHLTVSGSPRKIVG